jgi:hypothetical protein
VSAPSTAIITLYESEQPPLVWKLIVAACTGGIVVVAIAFLRWFEQIEKSGLTTRGSVALGMGVTLVMTVLIGTSRTVRRVTVHGGVLHLQRDPSTVESFPFDTIVATTSEPTVGGWSRDPAETLVLHLRDGRVLRYNLPDDADTPGIVHDLNKLLYRSRS